jgi:hypothetical protein
VDKKLGRVALQFEHLNKSRLVDILFTLENSHHYRNQNDIVTGNGSLPIRDW